jgi:hypothetical protein
MICIRERPAAADGDEARIAIFGKDHAVPFIETTAASLSLVWSGNLMKYGRQFFLP